MAEDNPVRFIRDPDVIAQPSGQSLVLFQMQSGSYFSLNECGSRIWEFCDGTRTEAQIAALVMQEYDAPAHARDDVSSMLLQLTGNGLLRSVDAG